VDTPSDNAVARGERTVAWWAKQADQVERDRLNLKWIPIVGLPAAGVAGFWHLGLAAAGLALTLVTWGTGFYMTAVRRQEFRENLESARRDLETLKNGTAGSS
jgi:hypothetical protein